MCLRIAFVCVIALSANPRLYADEADDFYRVYTEKHEKLIQHLWRNVRVSGKVNAYDTEPIGKHIAIHHFTAVANNTHLLYRSRISRPDGSHAYSEGIVITPDDAYEIDDAEKTKSFKIGSHVIPWRRDTSSEAWVGEYVRAHVSYPLFELRMSGGPNDYFQKKRRTDGSPFHMTDVMHNGTAAKRVEITKDISGLAITITTILDSENYLVLSLETSHRFHYKQGKYVPTKMNLNITYKQDQEKIPFPQSVKGWYIEPSGKKIPWIDVEYTEYKRYTPTPDEVDMEKQFGISPLPLPPRPELPATARGATPGTKIARWLYGSAALFAILTATIVIRARRRSRIGV